MHHLWVQGCKTQEDKEARRSEVLAYRRAFEDLSEILEGHFKKKEAFREYGSPGWVAEQIARNEYNQVIQDVRKLITLDS